MEINHIDINSIKSEIESIAKTGSGDKPNTLHKIANVGKRLIKELNDVDKTVYEISGDFDDYAESYEDIEAKIESANNEVEKTSSDVQEINKKIKVFEKKINNNEELTDDEKKELGKLYSEQDHLLSDSKKADGVLGGLLSKSSELGNKLDNYNKILNDVSEYMPVYGEAGEEIQTAARRYGERDMNVEAACDWNERSAISHVLGIGSPFLFAGLPVGTTLGLVVANSIAGYEMDGYLKETNFVEVSQNTFYNEERHEFISEYDVLEEKGGNVIDGDLKRGTADAYLAGKTVKDASQIIKKKADDAR